MSVKSTKCVRKLERPRPLRSTDTPGSDPDKSLTPLLSPAEDTTSLTDGVMCASTDQLLLLSQMESLCASIDNGNRGATVSQICSLLKAKGAAMESSFKDQLDRHFVTLRNAARDDGLDSVGRLRLLEVVELRAMGWQSDKSDTGYYARKFDELGVETTAIDDATAMKLSRALQQRHQPEQRSQMETVKAETKPGATPPILPWASQEIKNPENSSNPQSVSYQGPLKGEVSFQNHNIWKESPNLQDTQMHRRLENSDNEGVVQNANASTQGQQSEGVVGIAKKVISENIARYSGLPTQNGKWANGTTTDYLDMYLKTPGVPDGDAEACVKTVTVGKDVVQISGTNSTIVNMSTLVLRSFFSDATADSSYLANPNLSCLPSGSGEPSNKPTVPGLHTDAVHALQHSLGHSSFQKGQVDSSHGEAYKKDELRLVKEAAAWPPRDTLQSANATKAQSGQGSFERFGNTSGPSENKRFKGLESLAESNSTCNQRMRPTGFKDWGSNDKPGQTKQFDGHGSSMQFSRSVDNSHVLSTGSKALGNTSEPGEPDRFKRFWNPSQFSSKDDGQLLSAGSTALGSSGSHSLTGQFERLVGSMQLSSNTENQKLEASVDFNVLGNDRNDQSKQFLSSGSSTQFFSSFDKQIFPPMSLGTTDVLDQPKQFKGLGRQALLSSKVDSDNNQQPLSTTFTISGSTSGQSQTKYFETLGASVEFSSNTGNQKVPSGDIKPLGYTDGPSQAKEFERLGASVQFPSNPENQKVLSGNVKPLGYTDRSSQAEQFERLGSPIELPSNTENKKGPSGSVKPLGYTDGLSQTKQFERLGSAALFSSNPDEHTLSASFKTLSVNGSTAGKRQLKGLASSREFERSADDQQALPSSTLSVAAGPPCSTLTGFKTYTREFLLQCSESSLATQKPLDFPLLDPEVESAMVKKVHHKRNSEA
ncbi:serine-rich adhesin for platelets-like [Dermacentor albipictus]|uniref:serine-rich adhesin for platelets-like n=1 Tax=Dermacentor albipictus TaxID=60249 RepID=UPI0031FC4E47